MGRSFVYLVNQEATTPMTKPVKTPMPDTQTSLPRARPTKEPSKESSTRISLRLEKRLKNTDISSEATKIKTTACVSKLFPKNECKVTFSKKRAVCDRHM